MTVYENHNYEVIKMVVNDLVRYGVKPKEVKGFDYVSSNLDTAISQADFYDTLPLVRTWDI